ncbi:odorant receptor 9a-like [Solenopsis invicta]|uniref:odorant receptor 9a-like n=1 Tax=Solenopsis invicta TaxID=13686 RepID=UPI00193DC17B|nr:odorant receptor 9a-like [Solenopsis invicta]XP_039315692.1 odorant receptor 9a-like [Solenopsis invicta]XP_039315693.1 odorant receptor 9a-like [Solenopsis invicta]
MSITMLDKRLQEYRKYQQITKILLIVSGCWYMSKKSGKSTRYWPVCAFLLMIMYLTMSFRAVYIFRHKFTIVMKMVGVVMSSVSATIKVSIFMINRNSLINNHRTLNDFYEEELVQNEKIRSIIFSSLRTTYTIGYTYVILLIGLVMAYIVPPYIFIIRNISHFNSITNYTLPISRGYGYFWTVPDNFLYHLHLIVETIIATVSCITACAVENVFGFFAYQLASTMRGMTYRLTNPLPNEQFSDLLKTCIEKHQKLLRCRDILEKVYGPIIFWHIITNAMLFCSLIYDITTQFEFTVVSTLTFLIWSLIKLLQMFIYAWNGTVITNASDDFRNGIYFGEWPKSDLDRHVRTNVMLTMMQKPMTIYAIFSRVEIVLFTNFVNTTMSYFFLLQSIGDKSE